MIHAKGTTVLTEFYKRAARKRGTSKAIVATAAKMLRVIFWMLKKRITFAECQRQRIESRRNAEIKHLKNVKDEKGVKNGRKLAKNEARMTECQEIMVRDLRDNRNEFSCSEY